MKTDVSSVFQAGISSYKLPQITLGQVFARQNAEETNDRQPLNMDHIITLFILLLIGCLLGSGVFLMELLVSKYRSKWMINNRNSPIE